MGAWLLERSWEALGEVLGLSGASHPTSEPTNHSTSEPVNQPTSYYSKNLPRWGPKSTNVGPNIHKIGVQILVKSVLGSFWGALGSILTPRWPQHLLKLQNPNVTTPHMGAKLEAKIDQKSIQEGIEKAMQKRMADGRARNRKKIRFRLATPPVQTPGEVSP